MGVLQCGMTKKTILKSFTAAIFALGGLMAAESGPIHQEIDYKASPQRVYKALLDSKQFAAFTGDPAQIHAVEGGVCNLFGGRVTARNIELIPNQRIVQ